MSDSTTTEATEEEFQYLPLDQLPHFMLASGAPCFIGTVGDICKHVDALGMFPIYYVIGNRKVTEKSGHTIATYERTTTFKVVRNVVGRAVIDVSDDGIQLDVLDHTAWFNLPKIPFSMIQKMDQFFRTVYDQIKTEGILLLTFDTSKSGSDGWGLFVPDQENSIAKCDYQEDSIAGITNDVIYLVGSAHSHPEMKAYASPTDHGDQAHFDGLHITFGWEKSVNAGATQYHVEQQMQGTGFLLKPEQVIGDMPVESPSEDVLEWTKKVKKKSGGTSHTPHGNAYPGSPSSSLSGSNFSNKIKLPSSAPNYNDNLIIGELVSATEKSCPFCNTSLVSDDISRRRCLACHSFICLPGETLADVVKARRDLKTYSACLVVPDQSIYVWRRHNNKDDFVKWHSQEDKVGGAGKGH